MPCECWKSVHIHIKKGVGAVRGIRMVHSYCEPGTLMESQYIFIGKKSRDLLVLLADFVLRKRGGAWRHFRLERSGLVKSRRISGGAPVKSIKKC